MPTDAFFDTAIFDDSLFDTYLHIIPDTVIPNSVTVTYDQEHSAAHTTDGTENVAVVSKDQETTCIVSVSQ